jgi:hypothetical protein
MWVNANGSLPDRALNAAINGPTREEVNRMRERRLALIAKSAAALAADPNDSDDIALNADFDAWDIERDLTEWGHEL